MRKEKIDISCGGTIYILPQKKCPNCNSRLSIADSVRDDWPNAKLYVCNRCERGWGANKEGEGMVEEWRREHALHSLGMDVRFSQ